MSQASVFCWESCVDLLNDVVEPHETAATVQKQSNITTRAGIRTLDIRVRARIRSPFRWFVGTATLTGHF